MGVSTNANICYGIWLGEGVELPWENERWEHDIEGWWRAMNGFESIYDENNDYVGGVKPSDVEMKAYWKRQDVFDKKYPLLIDVVNAQSISYPTYILAVKDSIVTAKRGYPEQINPDTYYNINSWWALLEDFCAKYGIEYEGEPTWYLSSFWET